MPQMRKVDVTHGGGSRGAAFEHLAGVLLEEFLAVRTRNGNTREAYSRAGASFLRWCDAQEIQTWAQVQPVHVAAYVEDLLPDRAVPTVKQHLACIRTMFDWLVIRGVVPMNPAQPVRGPRHSVAKGSTPVVAAEEARRLLCGIDASTVLGLRDRAAIATMTYAFARVGAMVALKVEDYYPQKKRRWMRLHEKNGKVNEVPCHHHLEEYMDAYLNAARIGGDRKGPLFRSAIGRTGRLSTAPLTRSDVWRLVRRRAAEADIETPIGCHTFRATGITEYLRNGGRIEVAQRLAGHANAKTTALYCWRNGDLSVGEIERIEI